MKNKNYDIIIISANGPDQEVFWENRLEKMRGAVTDQESVIIAVDGGSDTLNAYKKAQEKGKNLLGLDLFELQKRGAAVALYHSPCALKLPALVQGEPLTILEGAILLSSIYGPYRKGRLSVFRGDQFFVPSKSPESSPQSHIEILTKSGVEIGTSTLSTAMTFALLREGHTEILSIKEKFCQLHSEALFSQTSDIGKGGYLWMFDTNEVYFSNLLKLTENTTEGQLMRLLFSIKPAQAEENSLLVHDNDSIMIDCKIRCGSVKNSILMGVTADTLEVDRCVIINCDFQKLNTRNILLYNVKKSSKKSEEHFAGCA